MINYPKFSDRQVWPNSVDSDQTAPESGSNVIITAVFQVSKFFQIVTVITNLKRYKWFEILPFS